MSTSADPSSSPLSPLPAESDNSEMIPFLQELGIEILEAGGGYAQIELTLQPRHLNGWHVAHGGVSMTMLDNVMSLAGRSLHPDVRGGVTIEMKTSFMQPGGTTGARLVAKGRVLHASSSIYFCEGELWNGERLVAKAAGTFKFIRRTDLANRITPA